MSTPSPLTDRVVIDASLAKEQLASLAEDARAGLGGDAKAIPAKYFYDAEGSRLFDAICDTPEYYPTRTEAALLEDVVDDVMDEVQPVQLVELGSGAARKTTTLLEAMHREGGDQYVPLDVSGSMLRRSAAELAESYPWLQIHALVGDYAETLRLLPDGSPRLLAFLGGTIGNYEDHEAADFLGQVREVLDEDSALLLGADLVKEPEVLNAAYNDADGLTEAFNKNMLTVLNRELGADFDRDAFEHVAFFDPERSRVEMHLRATRPQRVHVAALDLDVAFDAGETLHTEISRKFTRESIERLLSRAGLRLQRWFTPGDDAFSLSLAVPA